MRVKKRTLNTETPLNPVVERGVVRCAIYTRKSTEEGLEQEFNSLDAQREACEAYVSSQRHEGWVAIEERYDDGGFTGGNMDRPALKRLLSDIEDGRLDCILVYKVDRLSRSLLDFARMMEVFERHQVSFVSVTQQFNSANSMGRLTLNVLLSFAQFEREMIAERTRDKMSAARRKGKWVGGRPVLGYDVAPQGGRLLINEDEANQVKAIFQLYLEHRALMPVAQELQSRGWHNKRWTTKQGRDIGGEPWTKNAVFRTLSNIIYTGFVNYEGTVYQGEHPAIIDAAIWERVQEQLHKNGRTGGVQVRNKYGALLKGLLYCIPCERPMMHTYTAKKGSKLYRYYVCMHAQEAGWQNCPTKSVPAAAIESAIVEHIRSVGLDGSVQAEVCRRVQAQKSKQITAIDQECAMLEKELGRINDDIHRIVRASTPRAKAATERLAQAQDRAARIERRIDLIQRERTALYREQAQASDVCAGLSLFDPVWESLTLREQTRVMQLLVESVGFDGRNDDVRVVFTPLGMSLTKATNKGEVA